MVAISSLRPVQDRQPSFFIIVEQRLGSVSSGLTVLPAFVLSQPLGDVRIKKVFGSTAATQQQKY
tara:strand:- start:2244 stop:2438 length:195 start_codon:yes stop_codon:yes gene_type:complete